MTVPAPVRIDVAPRDVDWEALHSLVRSAYAFMDGRIDPPSSLVRMTTADFARKAADETLVTASSDGMLAGCLFCRPEGRWLYVGKMAVATGMQGSGIGRALMDRARALALERDLLGLELETRIELTENHAAFARMGFVTVAEQSHEGYSRITSIRMRWWPSPESRQHDPERTMACPDN